MTLVMICRDNQSCWFQHLIVALLGRADGGTILSSKQHKPGSRVTATGIYRVYHKSHRLMHEATLLAGSIFPCCKQCGREVRFELLMPVETKLVVPFRSGAILQESTPKRAMAAAAGSKRG